MKKLVVFLMLVLVSVFFSGCNKGSDDTVNFGVLGPHTGDLSTYGLSVKKGVDLAVEEMNANGGVLGKQVRLFVEDDRGDSDEAISSFARMAGDIDVLIGEVTSGNSKIVADEAEDAGIPMITPSATDAGVTLDKDYVFRACFLDPDQGVAMARFAQESLSATSVSIIYDSTDTYSTGVAAAFKAEAEALELDVKNYDGGFTSSLADYSALITTLEQADADVIFAPVYYEQAAAFVMDLREGENQTPVLGADGFDGILSVNGVDSSLINNVYFSNHYVTSDTTNTKLQAFLTAYQEKYGEMPNAFAALGYDAAYIAKAALEQAGTTDGAAVVAVLEALQYQGVTGSFKYNATGNPEKGITIVKYNNGSMEFVKVVD